MTKQHIIYTGLDIVKASLAHTGPCIPYNEELDNIPPSTLGKQFRDTFGSKSYQIHCCPSEMFIGKDAEELEYLQNFWTKFDHSWRERDLELHNQHYERRISLFKTNILKIGAQPGDKLLLQYNSVVSKGEITMYNVTVAYISQDMRSAALIMHSDDDQDQDHLLIVGYKGAEVTLSRAKHNIR